MAKSCKVKVPKSSTRTGCDTAEVCPGAEFSFRVVAPSVAASASGVITIRPKVDCIITGLYLSASAANYTSACTTDSWSHGDEDMYKYRGTDSNLANDIVNTMDLIDFTASALGSFNTINLLEPEFRVIGPNAPIIIEWTNGTNGAIVPKLIVLARYPELDELV